LPQHVKTGMDMAAKNAYKKGFQEQTKIDEGSIKFLKERGINVKVFTPEANIGLPLYFLA
jgi:hypothetical protein